MELTLPDITLNQLLLRFGATLVVLAAYGPVAVLAVRLVGDHGPAHDGRLTASPFAHLDVFGVVAAIFFRTTWMRDLNADPREFRRPVMGTLVTLVLTTVSLLALAVLALFARPLVLSALGSSAAFTAAALLDATFEVATAAAVLNLVPLPPLMGGLWWSVLGDRGANTASRPRTRLVGTVVVAATLLSGLASPVFGWAWVSLRRLAGF